jgi:hypothetical protein
VVTVARSMFVPYTECSSLIVYRGQATRDIAIPVHMQGSVRV